MLEGKFQTKIVVPKMQKICERCEDTIKYDSDSNAFYKIHFSTSYTWNITSTGPVRVPLVVTVSKFRNVFIRNKNCQKPTAIEFLM